MMRHDCSREPQAGRHEARGALGLALNNHRACQEHLAGGRFVHVAAQVGARKAGKQQTGSMPAVSRLARKRRSTHIAQRQLVGSIAGLPNVRQLCRGSVQAAWPSRERQGEMFQAGTLGKEPLQKCCQHPTGQAWHCVQNIGTPMFWEVWVPTGRAGPEPTQARSVSSQQQAATHRHQTWRCRAGAPGWCEPAPRDHFTQARPRLQGRLFRVMHNIDRAPGLGQPD